MRPRHVIAVPVLALLVLPACAWAASDLPVMCAHFVDVGQADAILLEFPSGTILVDTGSQDDAHTQRLVAYVSRVLSDEFGSKDGSLASVVLTHNHSDHRAGVEAIVQTFPVRRFVHNLTSSNNPLLSFLSGYGAVHHIRLRTVLSEDIFANGAASGLMDDDIAPLQSTTGSPEIRALVSRWRVNPGWSDGDFRKENNHSLVLRVDFGKASFLLAGDLEQAGIASLLQRYRSVAAPQGSDGESMLDVDVYKVGHHGSYNGTTDLLLQALTPTVAVICVGDWTFGRNGGGQFTTYAYGHPRRKVLDWLGDNIAETRPYPTTVMAAEGARDFRPYVVSRRIFATAWDGDVKVYARTDGRLTVRRSR